jgi:protein-tyrosine phosphatase
MLVPCTMFSRLWKRGKEEQETKSVLLPPVDANWAFLGADMHSHLIPGIDDGAKTVEESLALIRELAGMGFRHLVTTPHTMIDYYPNTTATIQGGLTVLQAAVNAAEIPVTVSAASEYYIDEYFLDLVEREPLLTITGNEVLVEFSMVIESPLIGRALFAMQASGYRPIIAHPERYVFFHQNFDKFQEFRDRGCLLQLNLLSLTGYYGRSIMAIAQKLMQNGMYDYCGTDMHHERHAAAINRMQESRLMAELAQYPFLNSKLCF